MVIASSAILELVILPSIILEFVTASSAILALVILPSVILLSVIALSAIFNEVIALSSMDIVPLDIIIPTPCFTPPKI